MVDCVNVQVEVLPVLDLEYKDKEMQVDQQDLT